MKRFGIATVVLAVVGMTPTLRAELILDGLRAIQELNNAVGVRSAVPQPKRAEAEEKVEPEDPAYSDSLRFLNGDTLHGNLVSIDPQKGVRWKTPDAKAEIEFGMTKLARISVARPQKLPVPTKDTACVVRLTNGDELLGEVVSLDPDKLLLDTAYAGVMTFARKNLQSLRLMKVGSGPIFEGPTGVEGWTIGRGRTGWKYSDNGFSTSKPSSIGRDLKLPALARLEFDLSWRGPLQLLMNLYTDGFEEYGNNAYMIQMNTGYIYMQRIRRNGGGHNMGQAEVPSLHTKSKVHLEILVNKEAKSIALLIDGALAKQWRDSQDWVAGGSSVLFVQQGMGYTRISNIRVTEWDGKLEERASADVKSKEDQVELSNHDKISGDLKQIKDGKMVFATAFANMDIPINRVQQIDLAGVKAEVTAKKPTDARLIFATRGSLTVNLDKYDVGQLLATSPNFGQVKFNPSAFNQLVFNLDQQKKATPNLDPETDDGDVDQ